MIIKYLSVRVLVMEKYEYRNIFELEADYWYYVGLRKLTLYFMKKMSPPKRALRILDAGCGTGGMLVELETSGTSYGIDISKEAIRFCKIRGLNNVAEASIIEIPFADNSFNIIISLDVLYHLRVESDVEALKELYRVLDVNGILLINVPAYNFLWSAHDEVVHSRHRYVRNEAREKVEQAGFDIIKVSYRNTILFPLILVMRLFKKKKKKRNIKSDLNPLSFKTNSFLVKILLFENWLMRKIDLPFGSSIFCIARKIKSDT